MPLATTAYARLPLTVAVVHRARLLALAGDETRLRILCFLYRYRGRAACVSDVAASLGRSVASVSHHLRLLRDSGLCRSLRHGTMVCYELVESEFSRRLKPLVCG